MARGYSPLSSPLLSSIAKVFLGRYYTFMPYRVPFNMVIGKAIAVRHTAEEGPAADAEVDRIHREYKAELRRVYEANKHRFGYGDRRLIFTCEQAEEAEKEKAKKKEQEKKTK